MSGATLDVQCLSVSYDRRAVLSDISFSAASGERIALIGPNGSGKSTLLRAILQLAPTSAGTIQVRNLNGSGDRGVTFGYAPQALDLWEHLTAEQHLALLPPSQNHGALNADQLLGRLGLAEKLHAKASTLSGGQRQRLALARALWRAPAILLLDEFTSSLDPATANEVMSILLSDLLPKTSLVLFATHNLNFARRFATRFFYLEAGALQADAEIKDLGADANPSSLLQFLRAASQFD